MNESGASESRTAPTPPQLIPCFSSPEESLNCVDPTECVRVARGDSFVLYTRHHIQATFNLSGCKPAHSSAMTDWLFARVRMEYGCRVVDPAHFRELVRAALASESYTSDGEAQLKLTDFYVASDVLECKRSFILLLGGTSGTGKSTLASLLASRLGISTVLSTDSIRHLLRSLHSPSTHPYLYASTYDVGELHVSEADIRAAWHSPLDADEHGGESALPGLAQRNPHVQARQQGQEHGQGKQLGPTIPSSSTAIGACSSVFANGEAESMPTAAITSSQGVLSPPPLSLHSSALVPPLQLAPKPLSAKQLHKRRVLQGFRLQSAPIVELLDETLHRFEAQGVSAIVEGVHLSVDSMIELCRRHTSAVPLLVYISNERKHLERFAVRSRHMTLDPVQNKYTKHFGNIRIIQKHLRKAADRVLVPKIDNTNVDRSLATIHATIVRVLRDMAVNAEPVLDPQLGKTVLVSRAFESTYQKAWSSKAMRKLIRQKVSTKGKRILLGRFLTDSSTPLGHHSAGLANGNGGDSWESGDHVGDHDSGRSGDDGGDIGHSVGATRVDSGVAHTAPGHSRAHCDKFADHGSGSAVGDVGIDGGSTDRKDWANHGEGKTTGGVHAVELLQANDASVRGATAAAISVAASAAQQSSVVQSELVEGAVPSASPAQQAGTHRHLLESSSSSSDDDQHDDADSTIHGGFSATEGIDPANDGDSVRRSRNSRGRSASRSASVSSSHSGDIEDDVHFRNFGVDEGAHDQDDIRSNNSSYAARQRAASNAGDSDIITDVQSAFGSVTSRDTSRDPVSFSARCSSRSEVLTFAERQAAAAAALAAKTLLAPCADINSIEERSANADHVTDDATKAEGKKLN